MFDGGRLDGAVLLLPPQAAGQLATLDLSVTPAGRVYSRKRQRYVEGAEVVTPPTAQRPSRRQAGKTG